MILTYTFPLFLMGALLASLVSTAKVNQRSSEIKVIQTSSEVKVDQMSDRVRREVRSRTALCEGKSDNILYPIPEDCTQYVLCTGDYEYIASCPAGLFYDTQLQACNYDEGGTCQEMMRRKKGVQIQETVQPEVHTEAPSTVPGVSAEALCTNRADGTYASPNRCDQYVLCSNGIVHVRQCPPGLMYRTDTNNCDFDRQNRCQTTGAGGATAATPSGTSRISTGGSTTQGNLASKAEAIMPGAVEKAMNNLMTKMKEESRLASKPASSGNRPFRLVQSLQRGKPIVKQLSMNGFILENATLEVMTNLGMSADKATIKVMNAVTSPLSPSPFTLKPDDPQPEADPSTCPYPTYTCTVTRYRSYDGSCNNLQKPIIGRAFIPLKRNLPADYGDGLETLRKARDGSELPNPRLVSYSIHTDIDRPETMHTLMVMQWGQFIDHDLSLTALTKLSKDMEGEEETEDVQCGTDGCDLEHEACKPIEVPTGDPDFRSKKCLMFVRSAGVPNLKCGIGPREQLNQITSYIDASHIYGSSKEESEKLRQMSDTSRGKLTVSTNPNSSLKVLLPQSTEDEMCVRRQPTCYMAGDERVNEQTALTSVHVIWLREHNRIEAELHRVNPSWGGERLYQETRRIIGALHQQITYGEFLPVVLGPIVMKKYGLTLLEKGFYNGYNVSEDASVSNVFATAAFRFGHSLLTPTVHQLDHNYKNLGDLRLSEMFFRPGIMTSSAKGGMDAILRGISTGRIQTFDRFLTKEVTSKLFSESPPSGLGADLASLNIQRSRDHGIPGYNAWRAWCGLNRVNNFDEMSEIDQASRNIFRGLYKSVDDIDIFPAGLAEKPAPGSLLGPTFSCILARDFARLRTGDRYWYENQGQFTADQLQELRKVKLSKLICKNADNITMIQPAVFESPFREAFPDRNTFTSPQDGLQVEWLLQLWNDNYNRREECSCLPDMDLSKFTG